MVENRKYRFSRDGAHEIETRYDIPYTIIEQHSWLPKWPFCSVHFLAHHIKKSDVFTWDRIFFLTNHCQSLSMLKGEPGMGTNRLYPTLVLCSYII